MRDFVRRFGWAATCAVVLGLGGCSAEKDAGGGCDADGDCARGEICADGSCAVEQCSSINDCPGSGRTCLADLRQCSPKECGDAAAACSGERSVCVDSGSFRFSCVAPGSLSCGGDADCASYGPGLSCCGGTCQTQCQGPINEDMGPPPGDAGPSDDMGAGDDAGGDDAGPDMNVSPTGRACSPCQRDEDCASLGAGATCTPFGQQNAQFCTPACEPGRAGQCPSGFTCVQGLNQCLPATFRCEPGCLTDGCPDGSVCDAESGQCSAPRAACGVCARDEDCAGDLKCRAFGGRNHCLADCAGGQCGDGFTCAEGTCQPVSGRCDACGGRCAGATPFCVAETGSCAECGDRTPCPDNKVCNLQTHTCEERMGPAGCVNDVDCTNSPDGRFCFSGECVQCLQDTDCGPGQGCDQAAWRCVPMPCRGVACQGGGVCDNATGRCNPGCSNRNDCVDAVAMDCNPVTGQCYYVNGTCDPAGRDAVCAPGSTCTPNLFDPNAAGSCSCEKEDPANPLSPDKIPCNPGAICITLFPGQPGFCAGFGM